MRVVVAIILAVAASSAGSQTVEVSDKEIAVEWLQLNILASGDGEQAGTDYLKDHGISEGGAVALRKYMKQAETVFNQVAGSFRIKLCQSQQAMRDGGQEALAQFIENQTAEENAIRREQVQAAEKLLSEEDRLHLHDLLTDRVHHGPRVGIVDAGNQSTANLARAGMITVEDAIERSDCAP